MNLLKKFFFLSLLVVASLYLTACNDDNGGETKKEYYVLPDLTGLTTKNYNTVIDTNKILITIIREASETIPKDEFIRYADDLKPGDQVLLDGDPITFIEVYFSSGKSSGTDNEAPVISGADDIDVMHGETFDPLEGITVTDNVDGDLMDRLIVTGHLDIDTTILFEVYTVTYTVMDKSANITEIERKVRIIPSELNSKLTDSFTVDLDYEGKSFLTDGIGKVTFKSCVDGDTAWFNELDDSVRFYGIDTPETAGGHVGYGAWGLAAKRFTCERLKNAKTIVLEAEGNIKDSYGRYLAYIWVDGKLLNLELVENAFSESTASPDTTKYGAIMFEADLKAKGTLRHIYGETDPEYDYVNKRFKN